MFKGITVENLSSFEPTYTRRYMMKLRISGGVRYRAGMERKDYLLLIWKALRRLPILSLVSNFSEPLKMGKKRHSREIPLWQYPL
jgi:hypothetical protein